MARIVDHLPLEALEGRYRAARDVTEARHAQAIWLLARGRPFLEVAQVLAFAPRWVEELAARYNAHGPEALGDRRAAAERPGGEPADRGWAGRLGRAGAPAARGWRAVERPQGRRLDGAAARPRARPPAARLGGRR